MMPSGVNASSDLKVRAYQRRHRARGGPFGHTTRLLAVATMSERSEEQMSGEPNLLYYGDNLRVLRRHVKDASVDDPPRLRHREDLPDRR